MSDTAPTTTSILVADDVEVCRAFVSNTLMNAGYDVVPASNGREALELVSGEKPINLLVLDVEMPELDGLQCLELLRANPKLAHLPVILLTAKADRNFILRAKALRVNEYLLKSEFRAQDLLVRVSRCLAKAAASSPLMQSA